MTHTHEDYTVGWIAALSDELTSAQAFLDEEHDTLAAVQGDCNAYTLGRIGGHNIVVAGLPHSVIGTNATSHAATNLFRSFPNVRFALMVGVGGGVPAAKIRLGDVVVSVPEGQTGGVIQHDLGTNLQGEGFTRKGFLRDPPSEVLTAVGKLRAAARRKGYKLKTYYDTMLEENPLLRPDFERPKEDNLFAPDYVHTGTKADCSKCDTSKLVKKEDRHAPTVHYGLIGSGNQVLRNATLRDRLHENEGIICFEMEAAGLMRNFECLVIRGICDYCDTHKNKHWQPYAGAVAAAYAKELLLTIPVRQVEEMPKSKVLESIHEDLKKLVIHTEETQRSSELQAAIQWLAASDPETNYRSALELRESGTGSWLVESTVYVQWKTGSVKHLWLHGKAGCGKSVIAATIIEDIRILCDSRADIGCAVFYFTFSDVKKQSYQDCLYSLVAQVATRNPVSSMLIKAHEAARSGAWRGLSKEESLEQILISAIQSYNQFLLILDALDESPDSVEGNHTIRQKLLKWLQALSSKAPKLRILATSRHLEDIRDEMDVLDAQAVSMVAEFIDKDIKKYVKSQLSNDPRLSRLSKNLQTRVEDVFMEKADGMFRWAYCQMRELKHLQSTRASHVEKALRNLPQTLDETYNRMIDRIQPDLHNDALVLLRWLSYSQRPLTLKELSEAMIIDPYSEDGIVDTADRGSPEDVLEILSGLIVFIEPGEATLGKQESDTSSYKNEGDSDGDAMDHDEKVFQNRSGANRSIRLGHFSVQEYLESTRILKSNIEFFHLQKTREQKFLSDCCVVYLMNYATSDRMTKTKNDFSHFPLLQYAAQFWYEHCRGIDDVNRQVQFLHSQEFVDCWILVHDPDGPWTKPFQRRTFLEQTGHGLYYAARIGLFSITKMLIEDYEADVNAQGPRIENVLAAACRAGHSEIVKMLIENKADVNAPIRHYGTALQATCCKGHGEIVKMLIENKADVNAQGGYYGTALQAACAEEQKEVVKMLIENKADVNAQGGEYGNALQAACREGHEEAVKMLIENKADVNAQGGQYGTALKAALANRRTGIADILVSHGAV